MTDLPQWAMEKADRVLHRNLLPGETPEQAVALALVEAEARGIERAAKAVEPKNPRPCDCERCYCGNVGDLEEVADWDARSFQATAIRKLMEQDNG